MLNLRQRPGWTNLRIIRQLQSRFPGLSYQSAQAAIDWASRAERNAAGMRIGSGDRPITAKEFEGVRPDVGCTWWRYNVLVYVREVSTGTVHTTLHTIQSATSLTRNQVHGAAGDAVASSTAGNLEYVFGETTPGQLAMDRAEILSAERMCP